MSVAPGADFVVVEHCLANARSEVSAATTAQLGWILIAAARAQGNGLSRRTDRGQARGTRTPRPHFADCRGRGRPRGPVPDADTALGQWARLLELEVGDVRRAVRELHRELADEPFQVFIVFQTYVYWPVAGSYSRPLPPARVADRSRRASRPCRTSTADSTGRAGGEDVEAPVAAEAELHRDRGPGLGDVEFAVVDGGGEDPVKS